MSPSAAGSSVRVPFADFGSAYAARRKEIDAAVARVIASGSFILGPEVEAFEGAFSRFLGVDHVIGCGNGTDAIALMLLAAGAGPDDEVVVPANACVPVAAGVRLSGARLRLADVDAGTLTLDPEAVDRAAGPRTRFVLAVHLYGGVADLDGLQAVAERRGRSRRDFAETEGRNSRLDELQAAILGAKLPALEEDNARRRAVAAFYDEALADLPLTLLSTRPGSVSAAHLYPVRSGRRDAVRETLEGAGVETGIHYPTPLHLQPAYAFLGHRRGDFPVSEQAAETVLSLPLHPRLTGPQVEAVVSGIRGFFGAA
ncbi:MAG: DegT/DnrJ/EryC1/StrS family aminotransferase [Acidobacteria bacterium]|nr:DegT/DnrJ/EryC1/StrS family aminotransferase [Acidobacteriota bacterium]